MARTNISVDQNVFDAFSAEAARQNKTLFAFANESLSVITKVAEEGGAPVGPVQHVAVGDTAEAVRRDYAAGGLR